MRESTGECNFSILLISGESVGGIGVPARSTWPIIHPVSGLPTVQSNERVVRATPEVS